MKVNLVIAPQVMEQSEMLGSEVMTVPLQEQANIPAHQILQVASNLFLCLPTTRSGNAGGDTKVIQTREERHQALNTHSRRSIARTLSKRSPWSVCVCPRDLSLSPQACDLRATKTPVKLLTRGGAPWC